MSDSVVVSESSASHKNSPYVLIQQDQYYIITCPESLELAKNVCLSLQKNQDSQRKDFSLGGHGAGLTSGTSSTKVKRADQIAPQIVESIRWNIHDSKEVENLAQLAQIQFEHQLSTQIIALTKLDPKVTLSKVVNTEFHMLIVGRGRPGFSTDNHEYLIQLMNVSVQRQSDNSFFTKRFINTTYNYSYTLGEIYHNHKI